THPRTRAEAPQDHRGEGPGEAAQDQAVKRVTPPRHTPHEERIRNRERTATMAVKEFGVVRGKRMRATRVDSCGLPIAGAGSTIVTKGFIEVGWQAVMKDAEDKEQQNADGQLCVVDRTPP